MTLAFRNSFARIPHWEFQGRQRWLLDAPTGWGKSVWLKQLALLRDAEFTSLEWNGVRVTPANVREFRRRWRYLPQTPLRTPHTIAEHLARYDRFRGFDRTDARKRTEEMTAAFRHLGLRIGDFAKLALGDLTLNDLTLNDLSGGELQAFSLVTAVLDNPEGLLLDEPTSAMDAVLAQNVEQWLLDRFTGSCIWVTHDEAQRARLLARGLSRMILS